MVYFHPSGGSDMEDGPEKQHHLIQLMQPISHNCSSLLSCVHNELEVGCCTEA